jgi:hypothetical protein
MINASLDRLVELATAEPYKEQVVAARAEFFARRGGEVFEDDKSMESRLASFLEWYVFDRPLDGKGVPPSEVFLLETSATLSQDEHQDWLDLTRTVHGLFELKRRPKGERLKVKEHCRNVEFEVLERRQMPGLDRGDLFEARLIPHRGELLFSSAFCYHPRQARKAILAEVKRRKAAAAAATGQKKARLVRIEEGPLLDLLSSMALKVERYRNVTVEAIYDFEGRRAPPIANG